jgi:hypothetical protein
MSPPSIVITLSATDHNNPSPPVGVMPVLLHVPATAVPGTPIAVALVLPFDFTPLPRLPAILLIARSRSLIMRVPLSMVKGGRSGAVVLVSLRPTPVLLLLLLKAGRKLRRSTSSAL